MVPRWQRKLNLSNRTGWRESSGTVAIVTGICLLVIMGMAGLALDLGQFYVVKSELQRAADAGALAGARALYPPTLSSWVRNQTPLCAAAGAAATTIATANLVDGSAPTVSTPQTGNWSWNTSGGGAFTANCSTNPFTNAVKVTVQRTGISLMFMGAFGFGPKTLTADSLGVMDWVGRLHNDSGGNNPNGQRFVLALDDNYVQGAGGSPITINLSSASLTNGAIWDTVATPTAARTLNYITTPSTVPATQAINPGTMVYLLGNCGPAAWANTFTYIAANYVGRPLWLPVLNFPDAGATKRIRGYTAFTITAVVVNTRRITGIPQTLAEAPGTVSDPGTGLFQTPTAFYGLVTSTRAVQ